MGWRDCYLNYVPLVTVIVPTVGRRESLRVTLICLRQACALVDIPCELVVVNDAGLGSAGDDAVNLVVEQFSMPTAQVVAGPRAGRAAARNAGAVVGRGERLLFVDEDIVVGPSLLLACTAWDADKAFLHPSILDFPRAQRWIEEVSALAPADVITRSERLWQEERLVRGPLESAAEWLADGRLPLRLGWLASPAGALAISRRIFDELGGFNPTFGCDWGCEDLELGYRMVQAGVLPQLGECAVIHLTHPRRGRSDEHHRTLDLFRHLHTDPAIEALSALLGNGGNVAAYVRSLSLLSGEPGRNEV